MKPTITLALALAAAQHLCDQADVELVLPGDWRREAVVYALAAVHGASGSGWDLAYAREHVSVTLPGAGVSLELLRQIPTVGPILADLSKGLKRPMILLSPSALADGVRLLGIVLHELGHVGSLRAGGPLWCLAYGVVGEVRAGAEAPCYGCDLAVSVHLGGADVDEREQAFVGSLDHYGLGDDGLKLARGIVRSCAEGVRRGDDLGGVVLDAELALRAVGWPG